MLTRLHSLHALGIARPFALALVLALAGCGSGGGGGSSMTAVSNSGTGSVAVVVTDAPSDDFVQIWLTVTQIELIGASGHFTLFEGSRSIDLLAMRDDARLLSLGHDVPAGDWSKIRLHVENVELIRVVAASDAGFDGTVIDCPDGVTPEPGFVCESITPKLPGNGKIDLNPRGPLSVRSGQLVFVQLDVDAEKSIHIAETGNGRFVFRPVVFVDLFAVRPDRLVRIEGTIDQIDLAAPKLIVCGTHRVFRANAREDASARSECVDVRVGADTSIFASDGQPAALADLALGDRVAALGRFRVGAEDALVFDAEWIQQGGFAAGTTVTGEVTAGVVGDEFAITPDPDGPVLADPLTVRLLDGAKLFGRSGNPVAPADLVPGERVRVFGVLAGTDPERLDASLVFVREPAAETRLHGTVTHAFDAASGTLVIQSVTPTSVAPACVALAAGDDVFRITDQGDQLASERIAPSQLQVGEQVDVFGHAASPCFDADTLISLGAGG